MKHWLSRHLLSVNENIIIDPTMLMCMQKLFDWANEMGLQGKKVGYLTMVEPRVDGPLIQHCTVWCKVECTEEEEKKARELQALQIKHAVLTALSEEDDDKTAE